MGGAKGAGRGRRGRGVEWWGALVLAFLVWPFAAAAQKSDGPDGVVREIYTHYLETEPARLVTLDYTAPDVTRTLFVPDLARLLVADGRRADPRLNFDPFSDGQDFEIEKVDLATRTVSAKEAVVTARFLNFDEPKQVAYTLTLTPDGWRIADIRWSEDRASLKALLGASGR